MTFLINNLTPHYKNLFQSNLKMVQTKIKIRIYFIKCPPMLDCSLNDNHKLYLTIYYKGKTKKM